MGSRCLDIMVKSVGGSLTSSIVALAEILSTY